ncbi:MAG: hypothetical protein IKX37_01335 [Bacteroidales bacterium]|nr:hypothetical protein [Bacteroidales bacterium]
MIFFGYKSRTHRIIRDVIFIVLGVLFLFFPDTWFSATALIVGIRILGVVLLMLGALEVIVLLGAMSLTGVGFMPFLLAVGTVLFGFAMLFADREGNYWFIKLISGLALLWYGLSDLLSGWKISKAVDEYEIHRTKEPDPQPEEEGFDDLDLGSVKEVEYRKED